MRNSLVCGLSSLALFAFGCDDGDETMMMEDSGPPPMMDSGPPPPMDAGFDGGYFDEPLYTSLTELSDDDLADQAVALLVGTPTEARCRTCHGLTPETVRTWGTMTDTAMSCIDGLDPNDQDQAGQIIDCFLTDRVADPELLGFVSTAVTLGWFTRAFEIYYPMTAAPEQVRFLQTGRMPKPPGVLFEQGERGVVKFLICTLNLVHVLDAIEHLGRPDLRGGPRFGCALGGGADGEGAEDGGGDEAVADSDCGCHGG